MTPVGPDTRPERDQIAALLNEADRRAQRIVSRTWDDETEAVRASYLRDADFLLESGVGVGVRAAPDQTACVYCGVTMYNGGTATGLCADCHRKAYPSLYGGRAAQEGAPRHDDKYNPDGTLRF